MTYTVTLTAADGHVFNNAFDTLKAARAFVAQASAVMLPGETIAFKVTA